jgi:hypothetical protein
MVSAQGVSHAAKRKEVRRSRHVFDVAQNGYRFVKAAERRWELAEREMSHPQETCGPSFVAPRPNLA